MLAENIEGFCEQCEIERLVRFYKSYQRHHRSGLLRTLLDGTAYTAAQKVEAKGGNLEDLGPQQQGGHSSWIGYKYRRLAIRILFLRHTQDLKMTPKDSRNALYTQFKKFGLEYDTVYRATLFTTE